MIQLSGIEDLFLRVETSSTPMHISSLTIYDPSTAPGGKVGFKDIMRFFSARAYRNRVFRNKLMSNPLGIGNGFWVEDPDFDIEFHLQHIALPRPGDWRQLCIQVARLHARHLDKNHPLWECHVIEGIDNIPGLPAGCFALLLKTHYAALGGGLGTQLLAALHEFSPTECSSPPKDLDYFDRLPTVADMLLSTVGDKLKWPFKLIDYVSTYFSPLQMYASGKISDAVRRPLRIVNRRPSDQERETHAPTTSFNGKVSPHRVFEGVKLDLAEISAMRDKIPGATTNDVLIAVIAGAMRLYLKEKGSLPPIDVLAEAPITSRSEMKIDAIRNLADSAIMSIHTQIEDPIERLRLIVQETRDNKRNFQSFLGKRLLLDATELVPAILLKSIGEFVRRTQLGTCIAPLFNTSISSIRGPDLPLYMSGARMVGYYGLDVVHDLAGLSHLICYFGDSATISITACRKMMPDPHRYTICLQDSYSKLGNALHLFKGHYRLEHVADVGKTAAEPAPVPKKRPAGSKKPKNATAAPTVANMPESNLVQ